MTHHNQPVIEVKNLVKKYKKSDKNAVDDISFSLNEGALFAFLGPNGAGKTTTIAILSTTLSKTSGTVTIAGYDLDAHQSEVRRNIGIIFQNPSLDLNLTAEENIRFHVILYGLYPFRPMYSLMPASYKHRVNELAKVLSIEKDIFKPVKTFSGGMRRKLEIVRSLMHKPKILFLDEPTSGLDPESRKNLWEYLKEVRQKHGTTIFLTTHYLEEAEGADIICVINHGKIISYGTPDAIKKSLVEEYALLTAEDTSSLKSELHKLKVQFSEENDLFKVNLHTITFQTLIQSIHTKLSEIKIHTPTLEEAYLEIIKSHERD